MEGPEIGFIGLGKMGIPMVRNLLRGGFEIRGFDLDPDAAKALADEKGFTAVSSPQQAAQDARMVILMLPDSNIVDRLLWLDGGGLVASLKRGAILIDMGSSDPVRSRENSSKLGVKGLGFIDAPVSGGVKRAIDGSLSIMIGGEPDAVKQAFPIFEAMGKTLVHVGSAGSGHAVKALNNYVSASGLVAVCEALVAAEKFGIDPHLVNQVFNASSGKNNTTEHKVESFMLSGTYSSGFAMSLMRKDLQTARDFIQRMGTPADFVGHCLKTWTDAESGLGKGADHTAMFDFLQVKSEV